MKNPFANLSLPGQQQRSFQGTGQSLGGSVSPGTLIPIELKNPGTLGLKVRYRNRLAWMLMMHAWMYQMKHEFAATVLLFLFSLFKINWRRSSAQRIVHYFCYSTELWKNSGTLPTMISLIIIICSLLAPLIGLAWPDMTDWKENQRRWNVHCLHGRGSKPSWKSRTTTRRYNLLCRFGRCEYTLFMRNCLLVCLCGS